ncbi:MAG TPA: response regulator transcription factor [Acidobacteriaceae bacterium]|nr:response regulator transcription factor [Acidobacteriaceae bacterium]
MKILIVDDEPQITRVLRTSLQSNGHEVTVAQDGMEALTKFINAEPELVITDLAMPLMNGIELTREIRQRSQVPVIVLSVRNQDGSKVAALDEGADDYITKPFSIQELLARVRVQSRRASAPAIEPQESVIALGDFHIDVRRHRVVVRDVEVHLTPKEFDLMLYFARNADRVLTHKTLLRAVWGTAGVDQPEYLRVLVAQLRKKIEPEGGRGGEPAYIRSEPWVGYRLTPRGASDN